MRPRAVARYAASLRGFSSEAGSLPAARSSAPFNTRRGVPFSKETLKRQSREPQEWSINSEQFAALKTPFRKLGYVRPPVEKREPGVRHLLQTLEKEEVEKVLKKYPREICEFETGDRIIVHKLISLQSPKTQVYKGLVTGKRNGLIGASFRLRCIKADTLFEVKFPINSPFIKKIEMQQKGPGGRRQRPELRWAPEEVVDKVNPNPERRR